MSASSTIAPEVIAEIRKLEAAATQGEWRAFLADRSDDNPFGRGQAVVSHRTNAVGTSLGRFVPWLRDDGGNADALLVTTLRNRATDLLDAAEERDRLRAERDELLSLVRELEESSSYWSEYAVPLGIVDRIKAALAASSPKPDSLDGPICSFAAAQQKPAEPAPDAVAFLRGVLQRGFDKFTDYMTDDLTSSQLDKLAAQYAASPEWLRITSINKGEAYAAD